MASKKKQKQMVLHQEGATTPAADHPPACLIAPKPGKASEGGMEQSTSVTNEEADMMGKPNAYPSKEAIRTSGGLPSLKHYSSSNTQSNNLSPDSICKGIRVTLDNNSMWNEFFRCKTEMILTKQGGRMFPYCRFRISGLQQSKKYSLIMDIQPVDNSRYKWTGKSWQVAGKAERHVRSQPFAHPESPAMGQHWMQSPVSFYKLKLTNNIADEERNTVLHPMHRYLPRLHVVQTDKAAKDIKLNGPTVVTFTFPQTEFMAVTTYQNSRFAQLKVDYNPFAKGLKEDGSSSWGLKLKLNSGKDLHKDEGTTTNEQHPVKKSLKSLLANHKPKSSKAVDSKPLVSGDFQKDSTTHKVQPAPKVTGECSCNSRPTQKLFSELIREAHVSLQRCNLEQHGINNSTSHRTEETNTKSTALESNGQEDSISVKTNNEIAPAKIGQTVLTKEKVKEDKDLLNSFSCKDNVRTDCSVSQNSSVDSDHQRKPEAPSAGKVKQHKRPAPLPLPALALFLRQHSTKSKTARSKPDCPLPALPTESMSESPSSATASAFPPSDQASKDLTGDITKLKNQASGHTDAHLHPDKIVFNVTGQVGESAEISITDPKADDFLASILVEENRGPEPTAPDGTPVLPNLDQPFCTLGTSVSTMSLTLATSSASPILSPHLDTVFPAPNSPQTPTFTKSSTLPSDSPTTKSESLLPDPECSSFGFMPLSPASSPEPLPSLPASLTVDLDSTTSEPTLKAVTPAELPHSEDSATSVFKWHTVLPPPEPYIDTLFTAFQPTPQTLPLAPVTLPMLPSQTPSHLEPQSLDTSTSTPPTGPAPSFQENEQSLPFPAELSPLTLQLPLSPTFSSLDGDGLSPTPSIADLVHFFSTDDDLGMGVEFSNTEAVPCPPLSTVESEAHEPSQQVQPITANKPCKHKKKSRRLKLAKVDMDQKMDDSTYTTMQPNLEEVEEQLFISFTSKEALKLHIVDSSEGTVTQTQTTPGGHLQQTADAPENVETAESLQKKIAAFEKILLRELKLMKHRQVIHPVLQEVGLKMNLLDLTLAIDLQYLGVRLPIPPPGVPLTQELPPPQGVCSAFVSRTGKTTDVTQIKGWREKFSPEAPSTPAPTKPEAGPSSDLPKKNLSAFCSDMLDEYLENEGKLIDERAASFSQPQVEPVVYELPTRSTSYVRTLDNILKKQSGSSPTSDLISGFIPPSKRPKLTLKESRTSRRENTKQKGPKHNKPRAESAAAPGSTPALSPAEPNLVPKQPAVQILAAPPSSEHTPPVAKPQKSKKVRLDSPVSPQPLDFNKRKKLKPKSSSQTLSSPRATAAQPGASEDMAPLESDSELGTAVNQRDDACRKEGGPVVTRGLLRQKDLEDGVVWEGRPRTSITEERASIALTSLFTLMGFVSENPTAPIQLIRRRAPPCLNEFCRLGCICSSLSHSSRISHCGRPPCMWGCSCLKQKVVLLKNLDGSDSSSSNHSNNKKRKRKRRMKMAYILKEADSVSQPAERVRTLWKRGDGDSDPDPIHVPEPASLSRSIDRVEDDSSCARVRGYRGRRKKIQKQKASSEDGKSKVSRVKPLNRKEPTQKTTVTSSLPAGEPVPPPPPDRPLSPAAEPPPKPSKRLIILAECKWASDVDRSQVLKRLCEKMARDELDQSFWIRTYLISPISQTVEESGADRCIQYKIHISRPKMEQEVRPAPVTPAQQGNPRTPKQQQQGHLKQVFKEAELLDDWQREVEEEEVEPLDDWQLEEEEAAPLEDWQREVEEGDIKEEAGPTVHQVHDGRESSRRDMKTRSEKNKRVSMALPFLTGISPAGFLSANRKQPGGTDHLVQVNGKPYPLAKIQLGSMGALHPANRLAAYLTGRVGSNRKQRGSPTPPSKPPQNQSSEPTPQTVSSASSVVSTPPSRYQPSVTVLGLPAPRTDSQVSSSVVLPVSPPPKGPQLLMVQVPGPRGKVPVAGLAPCPLPSSSSSSSSSTTSTSSGHMMVLQSVQAATGVQYFRRSDGKLVQLVPISQMRSVNPNQSVQRGSSSPSVLPAASRPTPIVSVVSQTPPQTTVTTSTATTPPSSLPSLQSFSAPPRSASLTPTFGVVSQKGMCTFKIVPSNSSKEPILVSCVKVPPPKNLISLKPSTGQGAELGVKTVTVSAAPVGPGGVLVHQKPASSKNTTSQAAAGAPHGPPPGPEVTPAPAPTPPATSTGTEPDIVCPDDETVRVTTETVGGAKRSLDAAGAASSETENSSDFESDNEEEKESILSNRAVQLIKLRTTETDLKKKRRRLTKRRDDDLSTIASTTEVSSQVSSQVSSRRQTGVMELVHPLDETDEPTENSSDEEKVVTVTTNAVSKTTNVITTTNAEGDDQSVAMETAENGRLDAAQRRTASIRRAADSDLGVKTSAGVQSVTAAFRALGSVINTRNPPKRLLLKQAHQEIQRLQRETARLKSVKMCLNQQRHAYVKEISQKSGKSEQRILRKLQQLSSKQQREIEKQDRRQAANQLPAAGGGASDTTDDDDIIITSSNLQQQTQQAPPTPVCTAPSITPARRPAETPGQQLQTGQRVLQVLQSTLASPAVFHSASGLRDKPRTMPNILSRSRNPAPPSPAEVSRPHQTLVTTEVLSLVSATLPGQRVLTLSPLMAAPRVLQSSSSPVTLKIPSLTNQQVQLTSLPRPPAGKIYSNPAPFTINNLTAANFNNVLQLVQPLTPGQPLQEQQQKLQPQPPHPQQLQVSAGLPSPLSPPPLVVSAGSDLSSDQNKNQHQPPSQTDTRPESSSSSSPPSSRGPLSSPCPGLSAGRWAEVTVGGPQGPEQQVKSREDADSESLTSLLNEIVFLNQQAATTTMSSEAGRREGGPAHSPMLLQLDMDSEDTVTTETVKVGLNDHTEMTPSGPQPGPANGSPKGSVLAPPPLLHMSGCGAKMVDPASHEAAGRGGGEGEDGERKEDGLAWRPMPRLVALGLRGNPPS